MPARRTDPPERVTRPDGLGQIDATAARADQVARPVEHRRERPTAKLALADSTPACGRVGAMASAARTALAMPLEVVGVEFALQLA